MRQEPTLPALACYAREHFGEDGYPFEESIPSSFDLVLGVYIDEVDRGGEEGVSGRATAVVQERLCSRAGFAPVSRSTVDTFVKDTVAYLEGQFGAAEEARRNWPLLSHLFWGNLVEARMVYGPLRCAACSCGYVMTGRDEEDLYGLVRRHLVGQNEPDRHRRAALPETMLRRRLVGEQDLCGGSWSSLWDRSGPVVAETRTSYDRASSDEPARSGTELSRSGSRR